MGEGAEAFAREKNPLKPVPKVLFTRQDIDQAVERLAAQLLHDYQGKNPILVGALKGSFIFMADLVRRLDFPLEIDFVRLASYGAGTETCGQVRFIQGVRTPVRGRHVLVVEDIVDTGLSISCLMAYLQRRRPLSLKLCALVDKPFRRRVPVTIDYLGLTAPDKFLVGYGLDWNEQFRHLPDICYLEPEP